MNREYPNSLIVEKAVLGSMILHKEALEFGVTLTNEHFFDNLNKGLFDIIVDLYNKKDIIDEIVITDALNNSKLIEKNIVCDYMYNLLNVVATTKNIEPYIKILNDKRKLRIIVEKAEQAIEESYLNSDASSIISNLNSSLSSIISETKTTKLYSIGELIPGAFEQIEIYKRRGEVSGIATGFVDLDKATTGLHGGELIILAGRPGTGKTALSLSIASNMAMKDKNVVFFSIEMSNSQLIQRILCCNSNTDLHSLRSGNLLKQDFLRLDKSASELFSKKLMLCEKSGITLLEIKQQLNNFLLKDKIDVIIIDYLQLIKGTTKSENKQVEVSNISKGLKELAKEYNCPVIALSQLSRAVEARGNTNHRPQLSDLRESGSIEQDADLVLLLYYEYNYTKEQSSKNVMEVIIGKQRNGPLDNIKLSYMPQYTQFYNMEKEIEEKEQF